MSEQGTPEWLAERAGYCTASQFSAVLAKIKAGEAATRRNYRLRLVTERLIGAPVPTYQNAAMEWGTLNEPHARMAYESHNKVLVEEVGFIKHATLLAGCSPDGLVGDDGLTEFKCPYESTVHINTIETGMPPEHLPQIMGQLWLTGRKWCDFVSFDPRMPGKLKLYVQRIERDEKYIAELEQEVVKFLREVEVKHSQLLKLAEAA